MKPIRPILVTVTDRWGQKRKIDQHDWDKRRSQLPLYTRNGKKFSDTLAGIKANRDGKGTTIHRSNIITGFTRVKTRFEFRIHVYDEKTESAYSVVGSHRSFHDGDEASVYAFNLARYFRDNRSYHLYEGDRLVMETFFADGDVIQNRTKGAEIRFAVEVEPTLRLPSYLQVPYV